MLAGERMKCFGPTSWCDHIRGVVEGLNVPDNVTIICLNPDKEAAFMRLIRSLKSESASGQFVIVSSATPFDELKQNPLIGPNIDRERFVDIKKYSVIEYLRDHYPAS